MQLLSRRAGMTLLPKTEPIATCLAFNCVLGPADSQH